MPTAFVLHASKVLSNQHSSFPARIHLDILDAHLHKPLLLVLVSLILLYIVLGCGLPVLIGGVTDRSACSSCIY